MNNKIYIFGHKKPDTDSVMSAIGLSYLKNQLGENTEARVLGTINKESKYALDYFNIQEPKYLNDVKLQLKDVKYHKGFFIKDNESIYDGYQAMLREELTGIPICKQDGKFAGLVTIKDLSHTIVNENMTIKATWKEPYTCPSDCTPIGDGSKCTRTTTKDVVTYTGCPSGTETVEKFCSACRRSQRHVLRFTQKCCRSCVEI